MLINSNLMLLMMLLCVGVLPIVNSFILKSPVCDEYMLPLNAKWVNGENCEDSKQFKCKKGYQSVVNTVCDNGTWNLEPTCQAVECPSDEKIATSNNVTQYGTFGEEFSFDCLNGSTGTMTCGEDGNWTTMVPCEVNGGWGEWSDWTDTSECNAHCATGSRSQSRNRICDNPASSGGGDDCEGVTTESRTTECNSFSCNDVCVNNMRYFPHRDSKKFWQCSNGVAYEMHCTTGTVWNNDIQVCDYPTAV